MTEAEFLRVMLALLATEIDIVWEYLNLTEGRRIRVSLRNGDSFTIHIRKE